MFKKDLLILLIFFAFFINFISATTKTEPQKNKKSAKSKKQKKQSVNQPSSSQPDQALFDQQLSCSCSCQTLHVPKKGKKAQLKVENRQSSASKKSGSSEIRKRKVPLRQGESRFKSLKKSYTQLEKDNEQKQATKQPIASQVPQQKQQRKIKKIQKIRDEAKSKRRAEAESKKSVQDQQQI